MVMRSMPLPVRFITTTLTALIGFSCLAACSAERSLETPKGSNPDVPTDAPQTSQATELDNLMSSADLQGDIVAITNSSFTIRPTQGNEETAIKALENVGTDRDISFADNMQISIVTYQQNTNTSVEEPATAADIKIDSSTYVWLNASGSASKLVLFRLS